MFAGHYGVSFAVKSAERRLPLWLLFLAVQFVDVLWGVFVPLGIEKVRIVPGITASNPLDLYYMPYTHSLVAALAWSGFAFLCAKVFGSASLRAGRSALFLALAVLSHWLLDLLVHRPDLPLYDDANKVGLGLWNFPAPALLLEAAVLFGGMGLYLRSTTSTGLAGKYGIPLLGVGILIIHVAAFFGPPPPSPSAGALTFLALYLILAAVAFWLEKKRA